MPAPQPTPLRQTLAALLRTARALAAAFRRLAPAATTTQHAARTTEWLAALARILAGDRFYHIPVSFPRWPHRFPPFTAKLRAECGLPALPPKTEAQKAAGRLHHMRKVFATHPTNKIAARLARRLGLTEQDPAWPHALMAIAEPPARITPARREGRRLRPAPSPFRPLQPLRPLPALRPLLPRKLLGPARPLHIPKRE